MLVSRGTWTALTWKHLQHSILGELWCWDELQETQPRQGHQSTYALTHPTLRAPFIWGINSEDKDEGKLHRSSPSRIQGNPQDERHQREKTRRTGLDGAKSARERERERERDQARICSRVLQPFYFSPSPLYPKLVHFWGANKHTDLV